MELPGILNSERAYWKSRGVGCVRLALDIEVVTFRRKCVESKRCQNKTLARS
jgi:hypothetical protein